MRAPTGRVLPPTTTLEPPACKLIEVPSTFIPAAPGTSVCEFDLTIYVGLAAFPTGWSCIFGPFGPFVELGTKALIGNVLPPDPPITTLCPPGSKEIGVPATVIAGNPGTRVRELEPTRKVGDAGFAACVVPS